MLNRNFCVRQRYRATQPTPKTQSNFTPHRKRECGEEEEEEKTGRSSGGGGGGRVAAAVAYRWYYYMLYYIILFANTSSRFCVFLDRIFGVAKKNPHRDFFRFFCGGQYALSVCFFVFYANFTVILCVVIEIKNSLWQCGWLQRSMYIHAIRIIGYRSL